MNNEKLEDVKIMSSVMFVIFLIIHALQVRKCSNIIIA